MSFGDFGNDLYTGKRSVPVVSKRRAFYLGSLALIVIALIGLGVRHLNLGLEFKGGSEFLVSKSTDLANYEARARDAVATVQAGTNVNVTLIGSKAVRVQTERLTGTQSADVKSALATQFGVSDNDVSATFIGPSWGASVSQQALKALIIFLLLVALAMAGYFRTWKMSFAALIALVHDLVITVGIYALVGFEVSPATLIGFLTVLGYSLYDTVVVFDKVRENTAEALANGRRSLADAANLAVNQTMVRSINTTVVALLPIASVLVVGSVWLGPGTLLDLSLVLFIGILVGAYSSIFIATPILVSLRSNEPAILELAKRAERAQAKRARELKAAEESAVQRDTDLDAAGAPTAAEQDEPAESTLTGRQVHRYASSSSAGPRNQPKRTPKAKR